MRFFHNTVMLFTVLLVSCTASANLLLSPTRLAFDNNDRVKEVILINTSDQTRSYRIEWIENKATPEGSYQEMPAGTSPFAASDYLRYSPRQVRLAPGERQTVKLMLRRKNNMALPEYRSHLKFTALLPENELVENEQTPVSGIGFNIDILTSYTIPVVVRTQAAESKVRISKVDAVHDGARSHFVVDMQKTQPNSVTGSLSLTLTKPDGTQKQVGKMNGLNFFHELDETRITVKWLDYDPSDSGELSLTYDGQQEFSAQNLATFRTQLTSASGE